MMDWIKFFFYAVSPLIVSIACFVTAIVTFFKGDPSHIPLAYFAGAWVFLRFAEDGMADLD